MAIATWPLFIRQSLFKRRSRAEFEDLAILLRARSPLSGVDVIQALLECRDRFCVSNDPLIPIYLRTILVCRLATSSDLLVALVTRSWNKSVVSTDELADEVTSVNVMSELIASSKTPMTPGEARNSMVVGARWLMAMVQWASEDANRLGANKVIIMIEAIGILLATIMGTEVGAKTLTRNDGQLISLTSPPEPRTSIQKALESCLPVLSSISIQLSQRFEALQKSFELCDDSPIDGPNGSTLKTDMDVITFESGVLDIQVPPSSVAMTTYLDAKIRTSTTIDDSGLLNFLNTRHNGNHEYMFLELISASFQVLANFTARNEAEQSLQKAQQFIVNKVPSLLAIISGYSFGSSFGSFSSEASITNAINNFDRLIHPPAATITGRFAYVCSLHHLISSTAIETLRLETPKDPNTRSLYQKDELVSQIKGNAQKAGHFIEELPRLDGNSGTIAQALVEAIHGHCVSKETGLLREISNKIARHPEAIDTIAFFVNPRFILAPLCALLDAWKWDDFHGESQPVYAEFGSILLLIQAFKRRLDLPMSELGIARSSTFMTRFFEQKNSESNLHDLTDESQKHLGEWINAMFMAEGLNDELTSSCSPQEFYLLIPTLLNQSLLARESNKLVWETFRSGFEYLLDPFLIPSLVPALLWLSRHAQRFHPPKLIVQVLQVLMKSPENKETKEIHHSILYMTAEPLRTFLQTVASKVDESKFLLHSLSPPRPFASKMLPSKLDLQSWSTGSERFISNLSTSIQGLIHSTPGTEPFTYLQIEYGISLHGAQTVLRCLFQVLHRLAENEDYGKGLDVIAALICSESQSHLRNGLRLEYRRLGEILKQNNGLAEEVVRLHRRVESLVVIRQQQDLSMEANIAELDMQSIVVTSEPQLDMTTAMATAQDPTQDIDEVLDLAAAMGQLEQGTMVDNVDDVFGNQDDDLMMNFDELDMDGMF